MANSRLETLLVLTAALLAGCGACLAVAAVPVAGQATARAATLAPELDFDTLEYQRGKVLLRKVSIQQGAMRVQAELAEAAGLDFDNNTWVFSGNVIVQLPEGTLQAARATVQFRAGRIATAAVTGAPATFAQRADGASTGARGHATEIGYDAGSGDVRLHGDAFLSDERSEISSHTIVYSIPQRSFRAEGNDGDDRVRGTIRPTQKKPIAEGAAP
jgi:lipopolysaccharide transport protein LptA